MPHCVHAPFWKDEFANIFVWYDMNKRKELWCGRRITHVSPTCNPSLFNILFECGAVLYVRENGALFQHGDHRIVLGDYRGSNANNY